MDDFRNKEELEKVVQEEQEVQVISQQNTIRQLEAKLQELEAERPNAELAMSFVSDMIKAGSAYQDENGTLQMRLGGNVIGNEHEQDH